MRCFKFCTLRVEAFFFFYFNELDIFTTTPYRNIPFISPYSIYPCATGITRGLTSFIL